LSVLIKSPDIYRTEITGSEDSLLLIGPLRDILAPGPALLFLAAFALVMVSGRVLSLSHQATTLYPIAACDGIEPGILGAWPLRRCSKQAFMYRRCDVSQWHCKLL
jgi:hypothetical protein